MGQFFYGLWLKFFFLFHIFQLINFFINYKKTLEKKAEIWWSFIAIAFIARFVLLVFDMSQVNIFMLWSSLFGLKLIVENKQLSGATLLAFATSIKLLPLVLLPYLFFRRWLKAGFAFLFGLILFIFLPFLCLKFDYATQLMSDWYGTINPN
ncbi:MAG: DUF2029 domain-containing protein, partial [Saprospiraceae bacterium]|nr:DUF2029 domain-containing protein [Saprospiraceae bacterium]